jgi:sRNA-binding carbon storage regulator CsrA
MSGNRVSIAIDAPREVHVVRGELKGGSAADTTAEDNLLAVI